MFDSLEAFRAHCGEPTMQLESCPICSAIPKYCYRELVSSLVADYEVDYGDEGRGHDDVPPQVDQLEKLIDGPDGRIDDGLVRDVLMRCPTCHRLYHHNYKLTFIGARNYSTASYDRHDVDTLFRSRWCVSRRLADRDVEAIQEHEFFRHHVIVRFREARTWFSLDETNHLVELGSDELPRLIASDPPTGLDDASRARRYAEVVGEVEDPEVHVVDSISAIRWRESRTDVDREQVDAARAAIRIEAPMAERADDHILVRLWVVSKKRLICRIVKVRKTGDILREDAVIVENLPVK